MYAGRPDSPIRVGTESAPSKGNQALDEDVEPEPEGSRLVNEFLDALRANKLQDAVAALRFIASLEGGELRTELLIPYFREGSEKSRLFPRRITFKKRSRGRPKGGPKSLGEF